MDTVAPTGATQTAQARGPSATRVRATLFTGMVVLGIAALVHVVRYLLLIINRNTLLNSLVAGASVWLGALASVAAAVAAASCAVVLTYWLLARRAAAFAHRGRSEPRPRWALWAGCLLPPSAAVAAAATFALVVVLVGGNPSWTRMAIAMAACLLPLVAAVWALVYVLELARTEEQYGQLRNLIWVWWLTWLASIVTSVFATATSFARDAQGIANNTVAIIVAYLLAMVAVRVTGRLFDEFERKPIERPAHRWVVLGDDRHGTPASASAVELEGEEPAA